MKACVGEEKLASDWLTVARGSALKCWRAAKLCGWHSTATTTTAAATALQLHQGARMVGGGGRGRTVFLAVPMGNVFTTVVEAVWLTQPSRYWRKVKLVPSSIARGSCMLWYERERRETERNRGERERKREREKEQWVCVYICFLLRPHSYVSDLLQAILMTLIFDSLLIARWSMDWFVICRSQWRVLFTIPSNLWGNPNNSMHPPREFIASGALLGSPRH